MALGTSPDVATAVATAPAALGFTALLTEASGTGKTTAAEAIAGELGLDVYVADLPGRQVRQDIGSCSVVRQPTT